MKHDLSSSQSSPQVGAGGSQATQLDGGLLNPPRLLGDGTLLEQRLLHSASWDAAPSGARARMEAALAPVLIDPPASAVRSPEVSAPERTAPAGSSKATATRSADAGVGWRWAPPPRSALLGVAGAGLAAYLLSALLSPPVVAPPALVPRPQLAPALDLQPLQATPALPADEQAPPRQPAAALPAAPAPQRRAAAKEKRTAQPATTLLDEVHALDAIRSALQAGELAGAARGLERYDQRFPRAELAREKSVLALDLLLASGQREQAQVRARALLAQPGMDRYAAHLRAVAEGRSPSARDSRADGSVSGSAHIRPRR